MHSPTNTRTFLTNFSWLTRGRPSGGKSLGRRRISGRRKRLKRFLDLGASSSTQLGCSRTSLRSAPGRSVESTASSLSPRVVIAKAKTPSGSVPKFASASRQVVETEQRVRITAARKDPSPVPKQVIEAASSSGPSRIASVAQPLLPPPPKGSVTRSLVVLEQRPKGPAESQSLAPPVKAKPKTVEQALIPQYHLPEKARYLTWDRGFLRDFSTRGFVGALGVYSELQADKTY